MAGPQLENGYMKIANEIMEQIPRFRFNGTQLRILMVLWRYTYGFNRKNHELSVSFISKATGINAQQIKRELTTLIAKNIVTVVREPSFNRTRVLAFNKKYDSWRMELTGNDQVPNTLPGTKEGTTQVPKTLPQPGTKLDTQEIHSFKDNSKDNINGFFEDIWKLYPEKIGKGKISASQKKKLHDIGYDILKTCIERYKNGKEDWRKWQHGSTFFNSGYIDYLDENYQARSGKNGGTRTGTGQNSGHTQDGGEASTGKYADLYAR